MRILLHTLLYYGKRLQNADYVMAEIQHIYILM